eukprot:13956879-Alexandrium_andersonii.AAC.1
MRRLQCLAPRAATARSSAKDQGQAPAIRHITVSGFMTTANHSMLRGQPGGMDSGREYPFPSESLRTL